QQKYGGVVPDLAAKLHLENIQKVLKKALSVAQIEPKKIDYIAYTEKPGLATFTLVCSKAKKRQTLDDAIGECLDKISLLLGYTYPGGPIIEKLALTGKNTYPLPLTKLDNTFAFSFSGLKTAVRRIIEREKSENSPTKLNINDLAYSLQYTLAKILTFKIEKVLKEKKINTIILGGGVIANKYLTGYIHNFLQKKAKNIKLFLPQKKYCTDNAAMIGILAYYKLREQKNPKLDFSNFFI
ncbi:7496_t:CDS:2, partial [Entrophospora sp. SA101]